MAESVRDRDVRQAAKDALNATGQFDAVYLSGLPEDYGQAAGQLRVAVIEMGNEFRVNDLWDSAQDGGLTVDGEAHITVLVRDQDPQVRDELAELLINVISNTLNGVAMDSWTTEQTSFVMRWRPIPSQAPERRMMAVYEYQYFVEGWTSFNTTE